MSLETQKANKRRVAEMYAGELLFRDVFSGTGIDIGGGADPLVPCDLFPNIVSVKNFDRDDGDAQYILQYEKPESYDFVYSSHCLEHMVDPSGALAGWAKLVKMRGSLIIVVPDEDLYEQGWFPSRFNPKHKFTFTIDKYMSWSPRSINLKGLFHYVIPHFKVLKLKVEDSGYNYSKIGLGLDQTLDEAEANIEAVLKR